jgi:Leucine-rich repeat (LRR) protein
MASAISQEGEALLWWKDTLLNSTSLSSWSRTNPTCSWSGILCYEDAGHVNELHLSCSSLNGTLDAFSFATFQHLTMLDLSGNNLFGTIPANISLLRNLNTLDLTDNDLCGAIPYQLSKLSMIVELYLADNYLRNPDATKFSLVASLQLLNLAGNKLNGTFPAFILNRTFVMLLDLRPVV